MLLDFKDMMEPGYAASTGALPLVVGFIAAFAVGCAACAWMLNIVRKGKLWWFAVYCVIMGVVCMLWQ